MKKLYGGIDLHGHNSVVVVLDEADQVLYQKRLPNELAKILPQLAPFRTQTPGPGCGVHLQLVLVGGWVTRSGLRRTPRQPRGDATIRRAQIYQR